MRPPFEKASMEKESVVKCYYDTFHCCLSPLAVQLLELEILFLNWSC